MLSHYIALVVGTMLGIAIMCLVSGNKWTLFINSNYRKKNYHLLVL